jgi:hypothetical protein
VAFGACCLVDVASPSALTFGVGRAAIPAICASAGVLDAEASLRPRAPPRRRGVADVVGEPFWLSGAARFAVELAVEARTASA